MPLPMVSSLSPAKLPRLKARLGACYEGLTQESFDELTNVAANAAYWLYLVAESRYANKQTYSAFVQENGSIMSSSM